MFRSISMTIFRGLAISTLCSHQIGFRCCTFVVCLCRMRPYTAAYGRVLHKQTNNELTATDSNLVTAQSTDSQPPENGYTYGSKHVGATSLKCF